MVEKVEQSGWMDVMICCVGSPSQRQLIIIIGEATAKTSRTRRDVTRKHKEVFLCCRETEDEAQGIDFKMPVITISFVEVNCGKTRQDKGQEEMKSIICMTCIYLASADKEEQRLAVASS